MGFFKKFAGAITGGLTGLITGGPIGAIVGAASGYSQDRAQMAQEKAMNAQLAAAQKIADAQNPANVITATTPTAQVENAEISEQNMAGEARRRYSFSKTLYKRNSGKLGQTAGYAGGKTTLG